jgi:hypothetical protein
MFMMILGCLQVNCEAILDMDWPLHCTLQLAFAVCTTDLHHLVNKRKSSPQLSSSEQLIISAPQTNTVLSIRLWYTRPHKLVAFVELCLFVPTLSAAVLLCVVSRTMRRRESCEHFGWNWLCARAYVHTHASATGRSYDSEGDAGASSLVDPAGI